MKQKIKSITEAFSMQPCTLTITDPAKRTIHPENDVEKIELEVMNETTNIYVGYNFEGNQKFAYLANSVNVHYF